MFQILEHLPYILYMDEQRGSYMSVHVLNILKSLGKEIKCMACQAIIAFTSFAS